MNARTNRRREGLILLIVLGMLSLLSLLAVTYVVFAGQSRTASNAIARRDFRETPPDRLLDQGLRQVLRGTNDRHSVAWKNDLLGDAYGSADGEDAPAFFTARYIKSSKVLRDNPERVILENYAMPPALATFNSSSLEGPELFSGNFLKIPIAWAETTSTPILEVPLPEQSDAWNGRVVTFLEGPLANQSMRIVRYVGEVDVVKDGSGNNVLDPTRANLQYSITVDLSDVPEELATVRFTAGTATTATLSQWLALSPASLLYENYTALSSPYRFMVNSGVLNSNGMGIDLSGTATNATLTRGSNLSNTIPDAYLGNRAQARLDSRTYAPTGDTDEPWDAADYQNFFLALKQQTYLGSEPSDDVIPSFHRPAVINYLAKSAPDLTMLSTPYDPPVQRRFLDFLELVQRATGRPISYKIERWSGSNSITKNPDFSGSNGLDVAFGGGSRAPQLLLDWSQVPSTGEQLKFQAWLRWQTRGPWDIDNDGDGVRDSVWTDLNYPLMTSPEGKLLKILVAFYIEDMDGRLDINAAGNQNQAVDASAGLTMASNKYAYRNSDTANVGQWPQGLGFGTSEISLRPLFTTTTEYQEFLNSRYSSLSDNSDTQPSVKNQNGNESLLLERNRLNEPSTYTTPATLVGFPKSTFPMAVRGKSGLGLDLLGNPIMVEGTGFAETTDDPYESHVLFHSHNDRAFTFAEYQRLVRVNDLDRAGIPRRLQNVALTSLSTGATGYLDRIRSMSPRNAALTLPGFALSYTYPRRDKNNTTGSSTRRVSSFVEFVEAFASNKKPDLVNPKPTPYFPTAALKRLFPIEFMQNRPLDLNRPLGNGLDDDTDGMIDEPDEGGTAVTASYPTTGTLPNEEYVREQTAFPSNLDPKLESEAQAAQNQYSGNQAKQLLARHLYCLAQLILPAKYIFPHQPSASGVSTPVTTAERARILAQWAVNVVDFRDPDAAMTRFAYDSNPFAVKTGSVYWLPGASTDDGVVWGVEQPELLMTETLAFHDLRIRRKPNPPLNTQPTEQLRVPQGSLFMEFIAPRTTNPGGNTDGTLPPAMRGLYTLDGTIPKLNLGATAPNPSAINEPYPVWRVAFLKPQKKQGSTTDNQDAFTQVYEDTDPAKRFNYSYQIQNHVDSGFKWNVNPGASGPIVEPRIDRVMWFAQVNPTVNNHGLPSNVTNPQDKIFSRQLGSDLVAGGQYLVVGPRPITYMGSKKQSSPPANKPSNHRFQLTNNWLQIWNQDNDPMFWAQGTSIPIVANNTQANPAINAVFNDRVRECVTMTAAMRVPADWDADTEITDKYIGLNVSEPTRDSYYTKPGFYLNSTDTASPSDAENNAQPFKNISKDGYIDLATTTGTPPAPLDKSATGYLTQSGWDTAGNSNDYSEIKTDFNWTAAVLQRLADPQRPYHEIYNPYVTVDWMSIDLTVFSGEETLTPDADIFLASREKTGSMLSPGMIASGPGLPGSTLYSYHSAVPTTKSFPGSATTPVHFDYQLETEQYCKTGATPSPRSSAATFSTLGFLNPRFVIRGTGSLQTPAIPVGDDYQFANYFKGAPGPNAWAVQASPDATKTLKVPFAPYFPNRDFVNAYELTNVPLSAPGTFFQDFSCLPQSTAQPNFTYTLDFEDLYLPAVTPPAKAALGQERSTAILFECVGVRSPWVDSWKIVHPGSVRGYPVNSQPEEISQTHLFENYRAPFNMIPTFREPGRINLNTITEPTVFRGLMWNMMTPTNYTSRSTAAIPYYDNFVMDRRGYNSLTSAAAAGVSNPNPQHDARVPTEFARVFTSAIAPDKFPEADLQVASSANVSLLRRRPLAVSKRLFDASEPGVYPDNNASNETPFGWAYSSSVPFNSFTHNYPPQRLANLTTNRSNVFAVRMTLGYFEYDVATGGLGDEYGAEQGRSRRHRAYYIVDRSIPVGYQTGNDLNTENCVLLRNIIE